MLNQYDGQLNEFLQEKFNEKYLIYVDAIAYLYNIKMGEK